LSVICIHVQYSNSMWSSYVSTLYSLTDASFSLGSQLDSLILTYLKKILSEAS